MDMAPRAGSSTSNCAQYSTAKCRVIQASRAFSTTRRACTQASFGPPRWKRASATRNWPGSGTSSASNTATKGPRAKGRAAFSALGLVRGPPGGRDDFEPGRQAGGGDGGAGLVVVGFQDQLDVQLLARIVERAEGGDEARHHGRLPIERHQQGIDREVAVWQPGRSGHRPWDEAGGQTQAKSAEEQGREHAKCRHAQAGRRQVRRCQENGEPERERRGKADAMGDGGGGEMRMAQPQPIGRFPCKGAGTVAGNGGPQPLRCGEAPAGPGAVGQGVHELAQGLAPDGGHGDRAALGAQEGVARPQRPGHRLFRQDELRRAVLQLQPEVTGLRRGDGIGRDEAGGQQHLVPAHAHAPGAEQGPAQHQWGDEGTQRREFDRKPPDAGKVMRGLRPRRAVSNGTHVFVRPLAASLHLAQHAIPTWRELTSGFHRRVQMDFWLRSFLVLLRAVPLAVPLLCAHAPAALAQTGIAPPAEARQPAPAPQGVPNFWNVERRLERPDAGQLPATIRFLTTDDFPPFNFLAADGALMGFNLDLARAICAELGASCTPRPRPSPIS